jgi:hypothetical protein
MNAFGSTPTAEPLASEESECPHGWLAEEATVFAIELAGALVSDLKSSTGSVETIEEHQAPALVLSG